MPRLEAARALTRQRFSTDAAATRRIIIPIGTRVADGTGGARFEPIASATIEVGATETEVFARAQAAGLFANGFAPGALNRMIDLIPGVDAVGNIEESAGGGDRETDARYRARLALAFECISRGGAREAYVSIVLGWSTRVIDVAVVRPEPGHIHIHPVMDMASGSPTPTDAERGALLKHVILIAPQGDFISVLAPEVEDFAFALRLILSDPLAQDRAEAAVDDVLAGWCRSLGGFIAPSELIRAAKDQAGVIEAEIPDLNLIEADPTALRNGARAPPSLSCVDGVLVR